jgi:hypothetical protein
MFLFSDNVGAVTTVDKTILGTLPSDLSVLISRHATRKPKHDEKNEPKFFSLHSLVYPPRPVIRL